MKYLRIFFVIITTVVWVRYGLLAQEDTLDFGFGNGGIVITDFGATVTTLVAQKLPDGKIFVVGQYLNDEQMGLAFLRYLPDGKTDTSFGSNGIHINSQWLFDSVASVGPAIFQSDGKVVVAVQPNIAASDFQLYRFDTNGSLDTDFGNNGYVRTDFGASEFCHALCQQEDGRLIAGGVTIDLFPWSGDYALARYEPDGSLDSTFGDGGKVITEMNVSRSISCIAVQEDGRILAFGQNLIRYLSNGTLDTSFGNAGIVSDIPGYVSKILLQPDGKIVTAGVNGGFTSGYFVLSRLWENGNPDLDFGVNGLAQTYSGNDGAVQDALLLPDGEILICGRKGADLTYLSDQQMAVLKFDGNGAPDSTFGIDGIVLVNFSEKSSGNSILSLPDGGLLVVGVASHADWGIALAALLADGNMNENFGNSGTVRTDFGCNTAEALSVMVQSDQKLLVGGVANQKFAVARYLPDGTPDISFGTGGRLISSQYTAAVYDNQRQSILLQPDGKLLLSGTALGSAGTQNVLSLIRINPDGSSDESFGTAGRAQCSFQNNGSTICTDAKMTTEGKFVVGGYLLSDSSWFILTRFLNNGSIDSTFGTDGRVRTYIAVDAVAAQMALQADGKILITGDNLGKFATVRYLPDGTPDLSFGSGGKVITAEGTGYGIAVQQDGKIIVAGHADGVVSVVRYLPDGSLDAGFGSGGKFKLILPNPAFVRSILVQSDNKILLSGISWPSSGDSYRFTLIRLHSNGTIDPTFGESGVTFTDIDSNYANMFATVLQADGKIVVAGGLGQTTGTDFVLARYSTSSGSGLPEIATQPVVNTLHIEPNPALDGIRLEGNFGSESAIMVTNASGRPVFTCNTASTQLNIRDWKAGLYFVRVLKPDGRSLVGKFFVQ